jgi:hypothetical protein
MLPRDRTRALHLAGSALVAWMIGCAAGDSSTDESSMQTTGSDAASAGTSGRGRVASIDSGSADAGVGPKPGADGSAGKAGTGASGGDGGPAGKGGGAGAGASAGTGGTGSPACPPPKAKCGNECADLQSDPHHCGACGAACAGPGACKAGTCCAPTETACGNGADDDCDGATDCNDIDCEGKGACKCAVVPVPSSSGSRDITFAAFGDTHAGEADAVQGDAQLRAAVNSIPAHTWPAGFSKNPAHYAEVRGALVLGDLTDSGTAAQFQLFRSTFGRCGTEGKLAYPVYEGYGNHDSPWVAKSSQNQHVHPVIDVLDEMARNETRPGDASRLYHDPQHAGSGHYAWKWDDIWFVHLNVSPGSTVTYRDRATHEACTFSCPSGPCNPPACGNEIRFVDPHDATGFFRNFVKSLPLSSKQQLVVLSHFGFGSSWWPDSDRTELCNIVAAYRAGSNQRLSGSKPVAAFLHGHTHGGPVYEQQKDCGGISFPQFNVGSPVCGVNANDPDCPVCPSTSTDPACPAGQRKYVHFSIFRLGANWLEAVGVNALRTDGTTWHIADTTRLQVMQ